MNPVDFADRDTCKEKIMEIIKENKDRPIAIAINGKWGVGKTYFWKNMLAPLLATELKKKVLYTSFFGKNNEQDIIQDLVAQFLKAANAKLEVMKNISKIFGKALAPNIGFIFNLFGEKDLRDAVVCIDDFERLSDKIPLQDILGLICELKENKRCSVIVLYNEDELFKIEKPDPKNDSNKSEPTRNARNKSIFEKYKEKVFDFQIKFAPSTAEQFSLLAFKLSRDFDSYQYLPEILNVDELLKLHHSTNLRDLNRVNYAYQILLKDFSIGYPSEDFEKTYCYLLYSLVYAYCFQADFEAYASSITPPALRFPAASSGLSDYFRDSSLLMAVTTDLLSPCASFGNDLLRRYFSPILGKVLMLIEQTGFSYTRIYSAKESGLTLLEKHRNFLKNFTHKILSDTSFHKDFLQELQQANHDLKEASINFFLKHQNNLEALPYIFGFRILNYSSRVFDPKNKREEALSTSEVRSILDLTRGSLLDLIMEEHKDACLELLHQWCEHAYPWVRDKRNEDREKYFWVDRYTFFIPLKEALERKNIDLPQNDLIKLLPIPK